jgi:hypothetical protein
MSLGVLALAEHHQMETQRVTQVLIILSGPRSQQASKTFCRALAPGTPYHRSAAAARQNECPIILRRAVKKHRVSVGNDISHRVASDTNLIRSQTRDREPSCVDATIALEHHDVPVRLARARQHTRQQALVSVAVIRNHENPSSRLDGLPDEPKLSRTQEAGRDKFLSVQAALPDARHKHDGIGPNYGWPETSPPMESHFDHGDCLRNTNRVEESAGVCAPDARLLRAKRSSFRRNVAVRVDAQLVDVWVLEEPREPPMAHDED